MRIPQLVRRFANSSGFLHKGSFVNIDDRLTNLSSANLAPTFELANEALMVICTGIRNRGIREAIVSVFQLSCGDYRQLLPLPGMCLEFLSEHLRFSVEVIELGTGLPSKPIADTCALKDFHFPVFVNSCNDVVPTSNSRAIFPGCRIGDLLLVYLQHQHLR